MKVEILYFDGCPTYETAAEALWGVFAEQGTEAEVELVAVDTDEEAARLRFPGSPTIRVDGEDLFPSGAADRRGPWALGCRTYITPEGLRGSPTPEMLKEAFGTKLAAKGETRAHGGF